jgi:hypothetical protein
MRLCALLAAIPLLFAADDSQHPKALRDFIASAMASPPELAANALLLLVESGNIADPKWKAELIESAWNMAPAARFPDPMGYAVRTHTDTDIGFLVASLQPGLSTSGLQSRAIAAIEPIDPKRAREMFLEMKRPAYEALDCAADGYQSHAPWFKALWVVAEGFTPGERREGKRTAFLAEAMGMASTPEDFDLAMEFLTKDHTLSAGDFAELTIAWAAGVQRAALSDRVFSSLPLVGLNLALELHTRDLSAAPVLTALRSYVTRHQSAARCGEAAASGPAALIWRQTFNQLVAVYAPDVPPIKPEEVKAASIGDKANVIDYLQNDQIKVIRGEYAHLRFGTGEQQAANNLSKRPDGMAPYLTAGQRSTPEWNQEALHFLDRLESWEKEHGQPTKDLFHQKCSWYSAFFDIVPEGELRDRVLHSYLNFLAGSPVERESPPEWFLWVNRLIGSREAKDRTHWLNTIEAGGDATIVLYARLYRLTAEVSATPPVR